MTTKDKLTQRLLELGLVRNKEQAERWLLRERIQSLGNKTAAQLILEGHADAVVEYIDRVGNGGYA